MNTSPYKFEAPWNAWEFSYHILHREANLVILSMAWLTREDARSFSRSPKEPDMDTLSYWLARLEPVIRDENEDEIIVVLANRTGNEEEAVYAGTSTVLGIQDGEVKVYGILGRGERELLVVDTTMPPLAKLISEPLLQPSKTAAPSPDSNTSTQTKASNDSGLSIDTVLTEYSTASHDVKLEGLITPISPTFASSPTAFFGPRNKDTNEEIPIERVDLNSLKVSNEANTESPIPEHASSPPPPPPPPQEFNHLAEPAAEIVYISNNLKHEVDLNSPRFQRPPSPKSRNASRSGQRQEPALVSHDLAQEPQVQKSYGIRPAPHSAIPEQSGRSLGLGPRNQYVIDRPKSSIW